MIVIDPGHGGDASVGRSTPLGRRCADGMLEKDLALALARQVSGRVGAVLTREGDVNPSLLERAAMARRHGACVFVSLHAQGPRFGGSRPGATLLVHPQASAGSPALAFAIRAQLLRVYGTGAIVERGVPVAVLQPSRLGAHVAGVQLEVDYDPRRYGRLGEIDQLGATIARGIAVYGDATATSFVDPRKVSCAELDRSFPIFTAMGTRDPVAVLDGIAHRAVEILDAAIGELEQARDRIAAGEPAAFPVLSDAVAWSLRNRMLMRVDDPAAWTGRGPRTAEQILRWLQNIRGQIAGRDLHYTCIAAENCDAETWAWVIPGRHRVSLCRRFWNPRAGLSAAAHADFQALTIIHEVSHIAYDTEDSGRGPGAAECIAQFVADANGIALDRDFLGVCGPAGPSEVQSIRGVKAFGRPSYSVGLALTSSRFQGDPVLERVSDGAALLRQGSHGEAVRKVQEALRDLGYTVSTDGDFGPQTKRAVQAFQRAEGLGDDGVIGRGTMTALDGRFAGASAATNVRVRRNITALGSAEITALAAAINGLKSSGRHHDFVRDHANSMPTAHRQPAFAVWHRSFILNYESELRAIDSSVTLPYWDWANDPGVISGVPSWNTSMVALLGGDGDPSAFDRVTTGPFAGWTMANSAGNATSQPLQRAFGQQTSRLPTQAEVNTALGITPYDEAPWDDDPSTGGFRNHLEGWAISNRLHNLVHVWVGGAMLPGTSPNDPVFFLHHAMVDRVFAQWQARNPGFAYAPTAATGSAPGTNDPMATANVGGSSPFTVTPNEMWTMTNLRDHLGATGIEVRYA